MMARTRFGLTGIGVAAGVILHASMGVAQAQAWTPDPGEATVSMGFQTAVVKRHYAITDRIDSGRITSNALVIDTSFGLTRKVAFDVALPYVAAKYTGERPHPSSLDNGAFHGGAQDFRLAFRYNLTSDRVVLTPFVAAILPSRNYEYYAHSAVGRNLRELQVGTYMAKMLDPVLPGAFVSARYGYSIVQKELDVSHNRSNLDLEVGYFITPALRAFTFGSGQLTHGGIDMPANWRVVFSPDQQLHHDQIIRHNFLNVGAGASVTVTDAMDVYASFMRTVAARNGHEIDRSLSVGVSFSVRRSRAMPSVTTASASAPSEARERSLVRCICQKGSGS